MKLTAVPDFQDCLMPRYPIRASVEALWAFLRDTCHTRDRRSIWCYVQAYVGLK